MNNNNDNENSDNENSNHDSDNELLNDAINTAINNENNILINNQLDNDYNDMENAEQTLYNNILESILLIRETYIYNNEYLNIDENNVLKLSPKQININPLISQNSQKGGINKNIFIPHKNKNMFMDVII